MTQSEFNNLRPGDTLVAERTYRCRLDPTAIAFFRRGDLLTVEGSALLSLYVMVTNTDCSADRHLTLFSEKTIRLSDRGIMENCSLVRKEPRHADTR